MSYLSYQQAIIVFIHSVEHTGILFTGLFISRIIMFVTSTTGRCDRCTMKQPLTDSRVYPIFMF